MKKKQILLGMAAFAALNASSLAMASDNPFATVPQSTGYYEDVAALVHDGLIDGYADSDFNTKHPLTRYEMAVFTAKAMSKSSSANAADTAKIQKLMKEFQSELTDMHVKLPGVKAEKKEGKKADTGLKVKHLPENWDINGYMRFRVDAGNKHTRKGDVTNASGGVDNHQLLWAINNKFNVGAGWTGELDLIGAKNGDGDMRTTGENTVGSADVNKIFAQGPLFGGKVRIGRTKGSFNGISKSLIMGQYYEGADYSVKVSPKWTTGIAWGKIDYVTGATNNTTKATSTTTTTTDTTLTTDPNTGAITGADSTSTSTTTTKSDWNGKVLKRGVSGSDMNPDGVGVHMWQLQSSYKPTDNFAINLSGWRLNARSQYSYEKGQGVYGTPVIGEINLVWQMAKKFQAQTFYAQSNRQSQGKDGGQNKAYAVSLLWNKVNAQKPHSYQFQLDLIHQERFTGIKSAFDLKNKAGEGQRGFIMDYRYVPSKNIMFDLRWMHVRSINPKLTSKSSSKYIQNQYRAQVYFYF